MSWDVCVTVVSLSCNCRTTVAQQSWVTRAFDSILVVCKEGPIYWVSDVRDDSQQQFLKHARLHPHESNEITGRFPLQLLQRYIYCPNIRRSSIHGLTNQCQAFRWFLCCSCARINANKTIFCSCWIPVRRLFRRAKRNRSGRINILFK